MRQRVLITEGLTQYRVCDHPHCSLDDFGTVMALNVRTAAQCAQALMPGMRDAGVGRIVNIASRTALGKEFRTFYGGSKAALISMAKAWALELAGFGVTANAVAPVTIDTMPFTIRRRAENPRDYRRGTRGMHRYVGRCRKRGELLP
ncbi:MAG: SDR family NAD(P)-dependent oxidoreductase [Opitutales bacterium]